MPATSLVLALLSLTTLAGTALAAEGRVFRTVESQHADVAAGQGLGFVAPATTAVASAMVHVADPLIGLGALAWEGVRIAVAKVGAPPAAGAPAVLPKRKELAALFSAATVTHGELPVGECDYDDPKERSIGDDVKELLAQKGMKVVSGGCATKDGVAHCTLGIGSKGEAFMVYEADLTAGGEIVPKSISCYIND